MDVEFHGFWKHYLNYLLSNEGGLFLLGCNYDVCQTNILSTFYHELLAWWAESGYKYIVWNNKEIVIKGRIVFFCRHYFDNDVANFTKDLLY